ncbi:hypothetical protein [Treponema sp.]|uniref:hypothetical protein n=1 Tax=Treponema sp. TaxID=166 RepID=UPI003890FE67
MSDIAFVKGDKEKNYTILDNTCIRDENLSWGAKGLHCFLMHLPGNWKIYKSFLISHFPDKRVALNNLINELVDAGYIEVEKNLRNPDGTFAPQRYIFYEKPKHSQCRLSTADNTTADNPFTENQHLLTTNKLNTNIQNTKLTNPETETKESVSESVFVNIIKSLFGGEYPFDKNFESAVHKHLTDAGIAESNLEAYLKYVFERTKLSNVQKSFEGLFRKLALANSIIRDFKNSCFIKKNEEKQKTEQHIKYIDCPICSTRFKEYDFNCPTCGVSVKEIKDQNQIDFIVKEKLYEMSESEKDAYEAAWDKMTKQVKERTGRPFLLENEKIQFWKEYGILN